MIYTPNYFFSEVCVFKSTHFDSAIQACTMVDDTVILQIGMCDKGSHMCPLKCTHVAFLAYKQQCKKATMRLFLLFMFNLYL